MRESDWQIIWDPAGTSPLVMLDYGDLMDEETGRTLEQLVDTGVFDFALGTAVASRKNQKRRLEFSRRLTHATAAASWDACQNALLAMPWGTKATLRITPRGGTARNHQAVVLDSRHTPATDGGEWESQHHTALRISAETDDEGFITILGGFFNPPNTILIIPDGDIVVGDTIEVTDVPGVPNGSYLVTSSNNGNIGFRYGVDDDGIPDLQFTTEIPTSPHEGTYYARLRRQVTLHAGIACEVWNGTSWDAVAAGNSVSMWYMQDQLYYPSGGSWTNLYTNNNGTIIDYSPKDVTFTPLSGVARWRRPGGAVVTIPVSLFATAQCSYEANKAGVVYLDLPEISATLTATGKYIPPEGTLPGGGRIRKKTPLMQ